MKFSPVDFRPGEVRPAIATLVQVHVVSPMARVSLGVTRSLGTRTRVSMAHADGAPQNSTDSSGRRVVDTQDWLAFMNAHTSAPASSEDDRPVLPAHTCVVTSAPDVSELSASNGGRAPSPEAYGEWLESMASTVVSRLPEDGVAVFYQTDVRVVYNDDSFSYVDKSYHVIAGARAAGGKVVWHRIALKSAPGTPSTGMNPMYTHVVCCSGPRGAPSFHQRPNGLGGPAQMPDVLTRGPCEWKRGTDPVVAYYICAYIAAHAAPCATTRTIVDPFCGTGCILACANLVGLDALGNDYSPKRCKVARTLVATRTSREGGGVDVTLSREEPRNLIV